MSKGKSPSEFLRPLATHPLQSHLGHGLHTLGLLGWILEQTGPADIYVSTFSTSDAFLRGFHNLKKKGLVLKSVLLADLKASKKTYKLYKEMQQCFDAVYLSQNHSKVVLVQNDRRTVTVISSQNQTYGDRAECTLVTTSQEVFYEQYCGFRELVDNNSIQLNGLFQRLTDQNKRALQSTDSPQRRFPHSWILTRRSSRLTSIRQAILPDVLFLQGYSETALRLRKQNLELADAGSPAADEACRGYLRRMIREIDI